MKEACFIGTPLLLAQDYTQHKSVGAHQSSQPFPLCLWVDSAREQRFKERCEGVGELYVAPLIPSMESI